MRKMLFILALLAWPFQTMAATYTAASCNQAAVQAAITLEQATPADGDIVSIPAGTCTWTSGITQTFTNSVTIQGAGAVSSTTGGSGTTGSDQTVIQDGYNSNSALLSVTSPSGKSLRITGIAFLQTSSTPAPKYGMVTISGTSMTARIDHCHFYSYLTSNKPLGVYVFGGVADHDYFDALSSIITNDIGIYNGAGWNGLADSAGYGNASWAVADNFGTSQFFFAEDDLFNNGYISDCSVGGRFVLRYSTGTGANEVYSHGTGGSAYRGCRAEEVYENNFNNGTVYGGGAVWFESSASLVWGNTVVNYKNVISVVNFRQTNGTYTEVPPPNGWGYCGNTQTGSTSSWDQNTSSNGYACLDQAGRGQGDLITGAAFPSIANSVLGGQTWPREVLDPIYVWDNTYTAPGWAGQGIVDNQTSGLLTDNQDYYQQFGTYGEPGSFDGTKGVGQGLYSAITATCTAGVAYWATDQNTFYVCNPTNSWKVYYTPYQYPYPYGPPVISTPQNLSIFLLGP